MLANKIAQSCVLLYCFVMESWYFWDTEVGNFKLQNLSMSHKKTKKKIEIAGREVTVYKVTTG